MGFTAMHHSMQHKIVPTTIPHKLEYFKVKLWFKYPIMGANILN